MEEATDGFHPASRFCPLGGVWASLVLHVGLTLVEYLAPKPEKSHSNHVNSPVTALDAAGMYLKYARRQEHACCEEAKLQMIKAAVIIITVRRRWFRQLALTLTAISLMGVTWIHARHGSQVSSCVTCPTPTALLPV